MNTSNSFSSGAETSRLGGHDQNSWREKYFSSLEDQEKEKKEADSTIDVLRRGLLSVSLAGDGLDVDLDSKLSKLRSLLKTARDYPSISELLQTIESDLIRLDTEKAEANKKQKQHTSDALALLLSSSIEAGIKKELKDFQKKIKANHQDSDLARKFESELIDLLLPLLTELSSDYAEKNPAEGLWNRFKKSVATSKKTDPSNTPQTLTQDGVNTLDSESSKSQNKKLSFIEEDSELFKKTKPFIIKLIKQLYDNTTVADVAKLLSAEISSANAEALFSRYPKVLNLIDLARTQDKKAFLDFLGEINYSLSKIDQSISKSGIIANEIKSSKQSQHKKQRNGIAKIRSILDTAKDLESAKLKTQEALDEIAESIEVASTIDTQSYEQFQELQDSQKADLQRLEKKTQSVKEAFELSDDTQQQPFTDSLTGLPNSPALEEHLHQQLASHKDNTQTLCVCVGDIKELDALNSKYGEKAGDKAIELLAREIEKNKLEEDFLSYAGNGQFVLTKKASTKVNASRQIDLLNSTLAELPFKFKGDQVQVLLEFAIEQSTETDSVKSLLEKMNKSLRDKKANRAD